MTLPHSVPPVPRVLRLVQETVLGRWRAASEDLYREVGRLAEAAPGCEVLVAGCGDGRTTEWLATRTGAAITGVDPDPERIAQAEEHARGLAQPLPISYQQAALDDLPHETAVFDAAVAEPVLAAAASPERAVAELARVVKPLGAVVLLQLSWSSELPAAMRDLVVERLGLRPRLVVEWKQMLREAGLVDIQVQDWTCGAPGCTPVVFPAAADAARLSWQDKVQILGRGWRQGGWREARGAVERETALLRNLSRERAIGFQLIKGVKWPHPVTP
jgi:SAM-dependent methyltransferase